MSTVLVVAPHPDDETLGCGGTLLRHRSKGDSIHWLIMTTISEALGYSRKFIQQRKEEIEHVAGEYGFASVSQTSFITTDLDVLSKKVLIDEVAKNVRSVKPNVIYAPFGNDVHSDHKAVFDAMAACTKSFRYPSVKRVCLYETISETEFSLSLDDAGFRPNLWIDISQFIDRKIEIMKLYVNEMGTHPFPRSERNIRALATFRGATAGCEAAEAFMLVKEIIEDD
ncbi:MAG: GlcNAc-PI de-N-acetylase [Nitrospirales bacterium]|nr:MAG: GlcNAc-PI de-N-acetylase [Nitrospirales bacterium]